MIYFSINIFESDDFICKCNKLSKRNYESFVIFYYSASLTITIYQNQYFRFLLLSL